MKLLRKPSICRRLATLWVHVPPAQAQISAPDGGTFAYIRQDAASDGGIEFHSCATCGCTTHWQGVAGERMAVNFRLADPQLTKDIPIRHWDGAEKWDWAD